MWPRGLDCLFEARATRRGGRNTLPFTGTQRDLTQLRVELAHREHLPGVQDAPFPASQPAQSPRPLAAGAPVFGDSMGLKQTPSLGMWGCAFRSPPPLAPGWRPGVGPLCGAAHVRLSVGPREGPEGWGYAAQAPTVSTPAAALPGKGQWRGASKPS